MADTDRFVVDPRDERRHTPGGEQLWNESWYFDFVSADATLGGYVRIGLSPNLGVTWYWACLVGIGRPLVTVIEHAAPLPPSGSLELRHDGLWADHTCEEPLDRWSLGLEAFAVSLDDPADTYRGAFGDRVPLGFDLEWETDGSPFAYPAVLTRYEIPCRVHGEVLVGDERIDFDGVGQRDHSWGVRDWWATGWCWTAFQLDDGSKWHAVTTKPEQQGFGYAQQRDGKPLDVFVGFTVDEELDAEGIPTAAALHLDDTDVVFEPTGWAPVLLVADDGRTARFPRGMGHFTDADGAAGVGWIEFNQPQPSV
ncbi:MAG: hypothetical protein HYX32_04030 [Actinobacteria bacterium]|nr:hypothetical protein [Actinomycetota bacterium]